MSNYILVDVEARGSSPVNGTMTEFGAVHGTSKETYHGVLFEGSPDPQTKHDHNPVNDAMGNVEAFEAIKRIAKERRSNEV